jgi:hypothetical protein
MANFWDKILGKSDFKSPISNPIGKALTPGWVPTAKKIANSTKNWAKETIDLMNRKPVNTEDKITTPQDFGIKEEPKQIPKQEIDYARVINEGLRRYNPNAPVIQHSADFAEQVPKYEILKKHPYLLPSTSILETSGGQHTAGDNNILNWGIKQQKAGLFNPNSPREVIEKAASGIGERTPYYQKFRDTGEIADFANVYAPPGENETEKYIQNLLAQMAVFQAIEEEFYGKR